MNNKSRIRLSSHVDAPCKNCQDRHQACWGSCEKYQAYKAAAQAEKDKRKNDDAIIGYMCAKKRRIQNMMK